MRIISSRPMWATQQDPDSKEKKKSSKHSSTDKKEKVI
jgi:hypothetical protein